ncbi:MAG: TolC family protein [Gemmataceae bacterium]
MRRGVNRWMLMSSLGAGLVASGCGTLQRYDAETDIHIHRDAGLRQSVSDSTRVTTERQPELIPVQATENADAKANIDFDQALETALIWNPTVRLAREAIREAEAQALAANSLFLPSLNAGINYHAHRGNLQRSPGTILDVNSQGLYFGGGARTLAAESVAFPGIRIYYPLADLITEPRMAGQRLETRRSAALAVQNVNQVEVAQAYLELIRAGNILKELASTEQDFAEIVRTTQAFAKAGQGREADVNRAEANRTLIQRQRLDAEGERVAASARLSELLNLDPLMVLLPPDRPLAALKLIDVEATPEQLVATALANRPEIAARTSEIAEARLRLRQEQIRPWLPTISAGFSVGGFGGGSNLVAYEFSHFASRTDFDVSAVWSFQNVGMGNRALMNRNRAQLTQAIAQLESTSNQIREDVIEAQALIQSTAANIETARRQLSVAEEAYREESQRIKQGIGLPLELLDSTRSLLESRLAVIEAISQHNLAQFRLLGALGTPPEAGALRE